MSLIHKLLRRTGVKKPLKVYDLQSIISEQVRSMSDQELLAAFRSQPHPFILKAVSDEIGIRRQRDLESGKVHASF